MDSKKDTKADTKADSKHGPRSLTRHFPSATNNVAELTGVLLAVDLLRAAHAREPRAAWVIYTDSQYAQNVISGKWKAKANLDLIAQVRGAIQLARQELHVTVDTRWCPAHCGLAWNERADQLATRAAISD